MKLNIMLWVLVFLAGFFSYAFLASSLSFEKPIDFNVNTSKNDAPSDWINRGQIDVSDNRIIINLKDASLSSYAPTGSMKPVFDEKANGIRIVPENEDELEVGDIISFQKTPGELIVHRIVEKGRDEQGTYFITKGDNNRENDGKVRFNEIKYVTVGVLW